MTRSLVAAVFVLATVAFLAPPLPAQVPQPKVTITGLLGCAPRPFEELTGQLPAEHLSVDLTFNGCQLRSLETLGLAPHFPTLLSKYPSCRPFQTAGRI